MSNDLTTTPDYTPDGFSSNKGKDRIIKGSIIKDVDGRTTCGGQPFPVKPLIVVNVAQVAQCWVGDQLVDSCFYTDTRPVDIAELNSRMPKPWKIGLDGEEMPPWVLNCLLHFLDEDDGSIFTMINSTIGMRIAFETLCDKVRNTRMIRNNPGLLPVVEIDHAVMKTRFGTKQRVEFKVVGWKGVAEDRPLLKPVAPPSTAEVINDSLPWEDAAPSAKKSRRVKASSNPDDGLSGFGG